MEYAMEFSTCRAEATFSAWRHTVLQIWSSAAEHRLRRYDEILMRLSSRMLAGAKDSEELGFAAKEMGGPCYICSSASPGA